MVSSPGVDHPAVSTAALPLELLRCPETGSELVLAQDGLVALEGGRRYPIVEPGIPLFAQEFLSAEAKVQQEHYDRIAATYFTNLSYPHTEEYMASLDAALVDVIGYRTLGTVAEICCGRGEAFHLLSDRMERGVGVDVSLAVLKAARIEHPSMTLHFLQGDATSLPLTSGAFDTVFMLGGIHHVNDRARLFAEIQRILKPGGRFYFREPVSDFALWRWLRALVYRLSPALDHETERPLRHNDTALALERAGFAVQHWGTHGFLGFCIFMNSDVLVVNRLLRFIPGIRTITRWSTRLDDLTLSLPALRGAGLQVIGVAEKPSV
jgi:ubiquinone/menaquinone biosynthesis C-methylase UbiE